MKNKIPFELRITLIYIIIGALWILFSDNLLYYLTQDPHQINNFSIFKGLLYVLITGILLFLLIKREIKKRNNLYDKLLETNKKAMEADRLKSAFLSNLSHYIRTPMNSILGFTELIQTRDLDEEKRIRFLALINEKSHHLLQTINNIIEISKIQEGQIEIENKPFSIKNMIGRLLLVYEQELVKKGNKIRLHSSILLKDTEDEIVSDYNKIYHILSSLLSNAVNFTEHGEIEVGVKSDNHSYIFFVKDTGPGISDEKQKVLFVNFMQGRADVQRASEGTGLGLFLSANLAKLLKGSLWLDYSNETGCKFCFQVNSVQ
jgi:signal transduction histidine kinase